VATNAHIGNYGIKSQEVESDSIKIAGFICKNFTNDYSRNLADESINDYFVREDLVAISDVDTRAIVKHIRDKGAMNAIISSEIFDLEELAKILSKVPSMKGLELASKVSTDQPYFLGESTASLRVAVYDFGVKRSILKCLVDRDCYLQVFPAQTPFEAVEDWQPDGYFISNGPGDPEPMKYAVESTKKVLASNKPLFGICLGHQILGLASGVSTYKMHHGHRGINHPVKNMITGKCEITSQNHGFGVDPDSIRQLEDKIEVTHINLNDGSIEGMKIRDRDAFSVQYHPEASPGPHDARYLFDQFIQNMKIRKPEQVTDEQHS
jgi:carbamoyl-phosphate synthase small subunit